MQISVEQDQVIRLMPETLANKIAAGEVVQRPASVVKELVENAVDAGARTVSVHVKSAGSELIQIIDDGCGMNARDAESSFKRHATSKIRSIEDLENIRTLGFRGEALASIAAVSQVTLQTRRSVDELGTEVVIEGGEETSASPKPMNPGTSISVRNLFYNVPARRKFLKRPATELKHILDVVQNSALAHPDIEWRLQHGGNDLLVAERHDQQSSQDTFLKRVMELFSVDNPDSLVSVEESTSYLTVRGLIGKPEIRKRSRGQQFLFVNQRPVKHRYLEHAVLSAYEYLLPEGTYPLFALFLDIDPRHVDVNVHPAKAEVKFEDESGVYSMLRTIVRKALGTAELTPDFLSAVPLSGINLDLDAASSSARRSHSGAGQQSDFTYDSDYSRRERAGELSSKLYDVGPSGPVASRTALDHEGQEPADLLWQLHDAYVLTQIRSGLVIVDQQAAHERILYEKALASLSDGFGLSQQLLFPKSMEYAPSDFALLEELLPDLRSLGFDIEHFGGRSLVMRGVPADIRAGDEREILDAVLEQYKSFESVDKLTGRENLARSIARKSAVKAGVRLNHKEMRALIDQLFVCEMPYSSPDGRPTIVKLSVDELRERFGQRS